MLTESFAVATADPEKPTNKTAAGIHFHELQPSPAVRSTFKKSSVNPNCLAISPTHVFAAQAEKAIVHVYNRERNNQEAVVPFPEKIRSLVIAGEQNGGGIVIIGMESGRIVLWELCTGRQVSTPQHHLHAVTCLAVDVTSNFILSGSTDPNVRVWSLPALLEYRVASDDFVQQNVLAPIRSLSNHRAAVTAVAFGHGGHKTNIAVSVSRDHTCVVWDYHLGKILHTFMLASSPFCLTLDPVDRAAYIGYEDGSVQMVDFHKTSSMKSKLYDLDQRNTPTQTPETDRWFIPQNITSQVLCVQVSYDGTMLLTGHQDGKVHAWDVARGKHRQQIADFAAPITNLTMLSPTGFLGTEKHSIKLHHVIKPRYGSFASAAEGNGTVPPDYNFTCQFNTNLLLLDTDDNDIFQKALTHPSFPSSLIDKALSELSGSQSNIIENSSVVTNLQMQNSLLVNKLKEAKGRLRKQDLQDRKRLQDDEAKAARKRERRLRQLRADEARRKREMGEPVDNGDFVRKGQTDDSDLSSDTDEITDSD